MIRGGDVTDIAWVFAWLERNCLITNQRETALIICHHHIIAKWFGKPQTKFEHLKGIILDTVWEVQFFE